MESINSLIRKKGALLGILLGLILLVLKIAQYYYITKTAPSFFMIAIGSNIILLVFEIAATALFCYMLRGRIGGFWTFRQAVTGVFIMFAVVFIIQYLGYDVMLGKVIDKDLSTNIHTAWQNANLETLKHGENPKIVKQREGYIDDTYASQQKVGSIKYIIQNLLFVVILIFVISLVFAALFKREPPPEVTS